ncbi:hypothetical protein BaRGS_00034566, partial [Batillaria attramentaria]
FLWAVGVLCMLGAMIYTLVSMLSAYDEYPFNTVTKVMAKTSLPFPGITICNLNDVDSILAPVDNAIFRDVKTYLVFGFPEVNESDPEYSQVLNTPIDRIVNSSFVANEEFVIGCELNGVGKACGEIFDYIQSSSSKCLSLKTDLPDLQEMVYAGPFSGIRLYHYINQPGYVIQQHVSAGIKLYVHDPDELPDLHSSVILLSPGFSNYVAARPIQYKFLPKPYMAFGDEPCVDTDESSFDYKLRLSDKYSYTACNLECTLEEVANRCGCRGVLNSEQVYFNVSAENKCGCPRPCKYTEYDTRISSAVFPSEVATMTLQAMAFLPKTGVRENYMEIRIYLDKLLLEEVVHEPVYTYISVMGTIGGQMGFFMGASLLTVAEVLEFCLCFLFRFMRRTVYGMSGPGSHPGHTRIIPVKPKNVDVAS